MVYEPPLLCGSEIAITVFGSNKDYEILMTDRGICVTKCNYNGNDLVSLVVD